jgi:RHS repeat-associated protein
VTGLRRKAIYVRLSDRESIAYDYIWLGSTPVAQEDIGGQTHWTVTDHLGTPVIQTNSSGAIYWQPDYSPTGAVYSLRTSDAHEPLRMAAQEAEELTAGNPNGLSGRFYSQARWYRPQLGRYTQVDPIGYLGGQYNLYAYAGNNSINLTDPDGLDVSIGWHTAVPEIPGGQDIGHAFYIITPGSAGVLPNGTLGNAAGLDHRTPELLLSRCFVSWEWSAVTARLLRTTLLGIGCHHYHGFFVLRFFGDSWLYLLSIVFIGISATAGLSVLSLTSSAQILLVLV